MNYHSKKITIKTADAKKYKLTVAFFSEGKISKKEKAKRFDAIETEWQKRLSKLTFKEINRRFNQMTDS